MLHNDFIQHIRASHAWAHPGNVNQLLEALDKLAQLPDVLDVVLERDVRDYQLKLKAKLVSGLLSADVWEKNTDADVRCMEMCRATGELIQAVEGRAKLWELIG